MAKLRRKTGNESGKEIIKTTLTLFVFLFNIGAKNLNQLGH
jgi:hypothetical protein